MKEASRHYSVRQLADLAGVSVRTLHYYDQIGLLEPSRRSPAGYRVYERADLLRLQQILFYRELAIPLSQIQTILDRPGFDPLEALENHQRMLQQRRERLERLIETVDKTIQQLMEEDMTLTDEELYEGFTEEQRERYPREARQLYGEELVEESEQRVRRMSKEQWKALKDEGEAVNRELARLMERPPEDPQVQASIARHYAMIENFYPVSAEMYRGLGQLYVENPEFRAYYDKYRPGLAGFMQAAMAYYSQHDIES